MAMNPQLVTTGATSIRADWDAGTCSPILYTIVRLYSNGSLIDTFTINSPPRSYSNLANASYYVTVTGYTTNDVMCDSGTSNTVTITSQCIPVDATNVSFSTLAKFYGLEPNPILLSGPSNPSTGDNIFGKSALPNTGTISKTIPNAVSELRNSCGGIYQWGDANTDYGDALAVAVGVNGTVIALSPLSGTWSLRSTPQTPTLNRVLQLPSTALPVGTTPYFLSGGALGVSIRSYDGHFWKSGKNQELLIYEIKAIGTTSQNSPTERAICVVAGVNFFYSTDGGQTWIERIGQGSQMNAMSSLANSNSAWLGGNSGTIRYAQFPFTTWTTTSWGVSNNIRDIAHQPVFSVGIIFVGDGGVIRTTTNGGSWTARTSNTTNRLNSIGISPGGSGQTAVVVGHGGVIRTSTDGITWTTRTSGTTNDLYGVKFIVGYGFIAVGTGGVIRRSTDLGVTWSAMSSPTTNTLYDICGELSTSNPMNPPILTTTTTQGIF
jgi:hypothetical protein